MNKDVIYIDVEDDITAIISKVKASPEKIVALVPPKRIGVLQSAVNLRLLGRAAEQSDKRLVVITNNHALMSLAASAKLPVAKNLQSKPELAATESSEPDEADDIIDGNELPVGEHARQADDGMADAVDDVAAAGVLKLASPPKPGEATRPVRAKTRVNVPNFNTFRKKMVIGIGAGVLLIAFLVWAIVFAPRATIVVAAKTNDSSINAKVSIGDKLSTDLSKNTIKAVRAHKVEKKSIDFAATGSKNVGEKATSTVSFSTNSISNLGTTIPAGTSLTTSGGLTFITDNSVTITISNYQNAPTSVTAAEQGSKYNAATGQLNGAPSGISANLSDPSSGGTDKVVKVVTAQDVQKAKEALAEGESKSIQSQLKTSLKNAKAVKESYRVEYNDLKSTPETGAESESGNAVLNANVTYSMFGVSQNELHNYLNASLKKKLAKESDQRIYEDGSDKVDFQDVTNGKDTSELTLLATAKIGPQLDEKSIKTQSIGRKTGEIQETLQAIQGIQNVDVHYFPFWVSSVPKNADKVNVQFKVDE